jgi:hypothetical protein
MRSSWTTTMSMQILLALSDGKILPSKEGYKLKKREVKTKKRIKTTNTVGELEVGNINQKVVLTLAYLINLHLWTKREFWTTDLLEDFKDVVMLAYSHINMLWDLLKQIETFYNVNQPKNNVETSDVNEPNKTSIINNSNNKASSSISNIDTTQLKNSNDDVDSGSDDYESDSDNSIDQNEEVEGDTKINKKNKLDYFILRKYDYVAMNGDYEMTKSHNLKKLYALLHMCEYPMKFGDRSYWNTETYESSNKHNVSVLYAKSSKRNNSIIKEMTEASLLKRHLQYIETYTKIKVSNQDSNIAISNDAIHSSNGITFEVNRTFRSLSLIYNNQSELCILSSKGEKINPEKIFVGKTFCKQKMINEISSFDGHKYFLKPNLIVLKKTN